MYYWAHSETPASVPQTPGRLNSISWPPSSPSISDILSPNSLANEAIIITSKEMSPAATEFKNSARDVEILSLEDEIKRLKQEVEKYKTLIEIQNLTANAVKDFNSPVEENKNIVCKNCDICAKRDKTEKKEVKEQNAQTDDTYSYKDTAQCSQTGNIYLTKDSPSEIEEINTSLPVSIKCHYHIFSGIFDFLFIGTSYHFT